MVTQPDGAASGAAFLTQPAVELRNAANAVVPQAGVVVTVTKASGPGTLTGTLTATTDASGMATFTNLAITGAGAHTLTFTSGALTAATSASFTVSSGVPTQLVVTKQPGGALTGVVFATQPVVAIRDAGGNPTTSTASVIATIATGSGVLSGTTSVAAVNGVATFTNLVVTGTGPHTLTFTSGALTPATSASFTVPGTTPTQLAMATQPAGAVSGLELATQPAVELRDASNAVVFQSGVVVTAAKTSGAGTLTGTVTALTDANGKATFANLAIIGAGAHTLSFGAPGVTIVSSASFDVLEADLVAGAVSVSPPNPLTTQLIALGAAVNNIGNGPATNVAWQLRIDGVVVGSGTIASLAAGAGTTVSASNLGPYALGGHGAQLVLDPLNTIAEANEGNNTSSRAFTVNTAQTVDVVAGALTMSPTNPLTSQRVTFTADVTNASAVPAQSIEWELKVDGAVIDAGVIATLPAGATTTVSTLSAKPFPLGSHTAQLVLDPADKIPESNEANNVSVRAFTASATETADLVAGVLTVTPGSPLPTQRVALSAIVTNEGNIAAIDVGWRLLVDGAVVASGTIGNLAVGASATVGVNNLGPYGIGQHVAEVLVDPTNAIVESSEVNNSRSHAFTVGVTGAVDLVAGTVTVTPASPLTTVPFTLSGDVRNAGSGTATNVPWQFLVDNVVVRSGTIASINAGETVVVNAANVGPYATGEHTARLVVDPANVIVESSESNNTSSRTFTASPAGTADLVASTVIVSPESPLTTQPVTLTANLLNAGNATAGMVTWQLRIDGTTVSNGIIESLASGESATVTANNVGPYTAGNHSAQLVLDPANAIDEASEENNTSGVVFTAVAPPPRVIRIIIEGSAGSVVRLTTGATLCSLAAGTPQVTCTGELPTTEKVAAVPAATSGFTGWSGACTGRAGCSIPFGETQDLRATFSPVRTIDGTLAARDLLTGTGLSLADRELLDRTGNADGVFNLGDLLAHLDRTGQTLSSILSAQLMAAPSTLSRPTRATPRPPQPQ